MHLLMRDVAKSCRNIRDREPNVGIVFFLARSEDSPGAVRSRFAPDEDAMRARGAAALDPLASLQMRILAIYIGVHQSNDVSIL